MFSHIKDKLIINRFAVKYNLIYFQVILFFRGFVAMVGFSLTDQARTRQREKLKTYNNVQDLNPNQ